MNKKWEDKVQETGYPAQKRGQRSIQKDSDIGQQDYEASSPDGSRDLEGCRNVSLRKLETESTWWVLDRSPERFSP